jgi:UDP-glucose 4-epimerase
MTVLVTGGSGFLGSHVAAGLAAAGERVVSGDVRAPEHPVDGVKYVTLDVTDADGLPGLLRAHSVHTVVHLASIVNPGATMTPEQEYAVDVLGSHTVLEACLEAGVRRVVVSSSGAAYGYHADNPVPLTESDPVRGNDAFSYSRHKRLVEEDLAALRTRNPELEQVVFRIGTILGPTVRNQITALWNGPRVLRIAGSDSPFVFIWIDDVVAAMVRAATDGPPGVYNLAGEGTVTVSEIASLLGARTLTVPAWMLAAALGIGKALRLTPHGPERVGFLRYRPVLDATALRERFGFTPALTSREAFERYLASR